MIQGRAVVGRRGVVISNAFAPQVVKGELNPAGNLLCALLMVAIPKWAAFVVFRDLAEKQRRKRERQKNEKETQQEFCAKIERRSFNNLKMAII